MSNFKRAGITAAVAAATASYVGLANSQPVVSADVLGDLAIVPYYTVQGDFRTGIHIINTTQATQAVKFRMRRAADSFDALDFNIIMSPRDEWVASIYENENGDIRVETTDTTCTAPAKDADNGFTMPATWREGAEEGYIEIIAMAQTDSESAPVAKGAKHAAGVPAACDRVRQNFFRTTPADIAANPIVRGVHNNALSSSGKAAGATAPFDGVTTWIDSEPRALKVSYFTRDSEGGLEFGNNAVHIEGFADQPMLTNQQALLIQDGALIFDPLNFELPNLDGGPYESTATGPAGDWSDGGRFGRYNLLRDSGVLGRDNVVNDWSARSTADFTVSTDWVVTMPGQYLMNDWATYAFSFGQACKEVNPDATTQCDFNDLPVALSISFWDREEATFQQEDGDLSVSPGGAPGSTPVLENEVNVIEWSKGQPNVLGSDFATTFTPGVDADSGWARLGVTKFAPAPSLIHYPDPNAPVTATGQVPIIGFAVWERNFGANADANYGRAIDHSYAIS